MGNYMLCIIDCLSRKSIKEQKRMMKVLKDMFEQSAFFTSDQIKEVLLVIV